MVGAQNVYESTHRAIGAIQTLYRSLQKGVVEGFFDDAEEEHMVAALLSAEEKLSYPQSDTSNSTYARIGGSLLANLTYWFPRFHYHAAIYYAPDGQENHCTVNLTNNLRANGQLDYNVRYTVTRTPINDTLVLEDARNRIEAKKNEIRKGFMYAHPFDKAVIEGGGG
ncbi:hypothetical protein AAVH_23306 [Aphelenchoides avenae]|nr:hypothetical protein AAVH_23306 [Aphelenchus avenae]